MVHVLHLHYMCCTYSTCASFTVHVLHLHYILFIYSAGALLALYVLFLQYACSNFSTADVIVVLCCGTYDLYACRFPDSLEKFG